MWFKYLLIVLMSMSMGITINEESKTHQERLINLIIQSLIILGIIIYL